MHNFRPNGPKGPVRTEGARAVTGRWCPHSAQCAFCQVRWPCGQNGPVYATGPYYVAHVVDTGP